MEASDERVHQFGSVGEGGRQVLAQTKLSELVAEVDPRQMLDEDVEDLLMQMTDDFIESVVTASCKLARHRKSTTLETKDLNLHLERAWNMVIPGYSSEEPAQQQQQQHRKSVATEAHKQRVNLIKKSKR